MASTTSQRLPAASGNGSRPAHSPVQAGVFGVGAAIPDRVVTNADLAERLDTSDEWIVRRTGIRERRIIDEGQSLAELATLSCTRAVEDAGLRGEDVDLVIVSTITPDRLTPGLAPEIARAIGAARAGAVDINAACAGFVYAIDQAAAMVESGRARTVLVCGAEAVSRITEHDERSTAVLFGDGAGAIVVGAATDVAVGCSGFVLRADGSCADLLYAEGPHPVLRMEGREVYRRAIAEMAASTTEALERVGLTLDDVDLFVAHQANARIIDAAAAELGLPPEKVVVNVDRMANTSSASIPLALAEAEADGRLKPGAIVALSAFGAGFVWGSGVISWKDGARAA